MHGSDERSAIPNVDGSEKYQPIRGLQQVPRLRWDLVLLSVLCISGLLGLVVIFRFPPTEYRFYPGCSFYDVTGLHCPGCGGFRAWHELLHGRVLSALHKNALAITLLPGLVFYWILRRFFWSADGPGSLGHSTRLQVLLLVATLAFGFLRNIPWGPFLWFAP